MRFTIRDVLFVIVIAGLVLGWALDHYRLVHPATRYYHLEAGVKASGWNVAWRTVEGEPTEALTLTPPK